MQYSDCDIDDDEEGASIRNQIKGGFLHKEKKNKVSNTQDSHRQSVFVDVSLNREENQSFELTEENMKDTSEFIADHDFVIHNRLEKSSKLATMN